MALFFFFSFFSFCFVFFFSRGGGISMKKISGYYHARSMLRNEIGYEISRSPAVKPLGKASDADSYLRYNQYQRNIIEMETENV